MDLHGPLFAESSRLIYFFKGPELTASPEGNEEQHKSLSRGSDEIDTVLRDKRRNERDVAEQAERSREATDAKQLFAELDTDSNRVDTETIQAVGEKVREWFDEQEVTVGDVIEQSANAGGRAVNRETANQVGEQIRDWFAEASAEDESEGRDN